MTERFRTLSALVMAGFLSIIPIEAQGWKFVGTPFGCSRTVFGPLVVAAGGGYFCIQGAGCADGIHNTRTYELAGPNIGWNCTGASPTVDTYGIVEGNTYPTGPGPLHDQMVNTGEIRHLSQSNALQFSNQYRVSYRFCDGSGYYDAPLYHDAGSCAA